MKTTLSNIMKLTNDEQAYSYLVYGPTTTIPVTLIKRFSIATKWMGDYDKSGRYYRTPELATKNLVEDMRYRIAIENIGLEAKHSVLGNVFKRWIMKVFNSTKFNIIQTGIANNEKNIKQFSKMIELMKTSNFVGQLGNIFDISSSLPVLKRYVMNKENPSIFINHSGDDITEYPIVAIRFSSLLEDESDADDAFLRSEPKEMNILFDMKYIDIAIDYAKDEDVVQTLVIPHNKKIEDIDPMFSFSRKNLEKKIRSRNSIQMAKRNMILDM